MSTSTEVQKGYKGEDLFAVVARTGELPPGLKDEEVGEFYVYSKARSNACDLLIRKLIKTGNINQQLQAAKADKAKADEVLTMVEREIGRRAHETPQTRKGRLSTPKQGEQKKAQKLGASKKELERGERFDKDSEGMEKAIDRIKKEGGSPSPSAVEREMKKEAESQQREKAQQSTYGLDQLGKNRLLSAIGVSHVLDKLDEIVKLFLPMVNFDKVNRQQMDTVRGCVRACFKRMEKIVAVLSSIEAPTAFKGTMLKHDIEDALKKLDEPLPAEYEVKPDQEAAQTEGTAQVTQTSEGAH